MHNRFQKKDKTKESTQKYNAKKTEIDWITFDSLLESRFYIWLRDNIYWIKLLWRQNKFILQDKFRTKDWEAIREIYYKCDFHIEYQWDIYYIDSKWNSDAVFKLKHKMWLKKYWQENILLVCKSIKQLCEMLWIEYKTIRKPKEVSLI